MNSSDSNRFTIDLRLDELLFLRELLSMTQDDINSVLEDILAQREKMSIEDFDKQMDWAIKRSIVTSSLVLAVGKTISDTLK